MRIYNPQEIEKNILKFWEENKIFEKLVKKNKGNKKFSFLDGPITANNPMGVHHAWGRTLKDVMQRFKAMQGFEQRYQNGFDEQGLHVEVGVEKALGFNSKQEIEKFGLDKFSKACKESVLKFAKKQTEQSIRLGQWMKWGEDYHTSSDQNIEAIWHFLKKCHENGWLYKKKKVLPWCPRCGTSESKHEMSDEGYKTLTHTALFMKLPLKGRKNEFVLVFTTAPWTVPANIALAFNPNITYVKVKQDDEYYWLAEQALRQLKGNYEIVEKKQSGEFENMEYEMPYGDLPAQREVKKHIIVLSELAAGEEGTGIVHIAPGCGPEDFELGKEKGLAAISPLNRDGTFMDGYGWLVGKYAKTANPEIIEDLEKRGFVYKTEPYSHRYPICWRCKEELVFRFDHEWFISCDYIRPKMKRAAERVNWHPEHIGKLMLDWLTNMEDWNISRKRYWGLPLMFYECHCGHLEVIGSLKELKQKAVEPKKVEELPELHRPWIDEIKIKCPECGKVVKRIKEVGDCWLDAGIVPFSTLKYFEDKKYWNEWFPAELIIEMRAQVRLWFYSMLFMSVTFEGVSPYKNVLGYEEVMDERGEPMHKSKGNVIWFDEAVERMGADVMRWMYTTQDPRFNLNFGYTPAKEIYKVLNILSNTMDYVNTYCEANSFKPRKIKRVDVASEWIISRMESLKESVTKNLEVLNCNAATREIENFLLYDFSRWYIHIIRSEVKPGEESKNKQIVLNTLYGISADLLKLLAPFIPFAAEHFYQMYFRKFEKIESVHLNDWPQPNKKLINKKLEEQMKIISKIIESCQSARQNAKLKLRWPIKQLVVVSDNNKVKNATRELNEILLKMCNSKSVKVVKQKPKGKFSEAEFDLGKIAMESKLDAELLEEAMMRELSREIQSMRKKNGFNVKEGILLSLDSDAETCKVLNKYENVLKKQVGAKKVAVGKLEGKFKGKLQFEDKEIEIAFGKSN